jgi:DNA-binding protein HU-beta
MKKPAKKSPTKAPAKKAPAKKAPAKKAPARARVTASKTSSKAVGGRRPTRRSAQPKSRSATAPASNEVAAGPGIRDGRGSNNNVA